ncbi:MAG TPA: SCO family protein [Microthrixaceae bacterium]|nr:SCO family protein [Microthrixaceae bacterium]
MRSLASVPLVAIALLLGACSGSEPVEKVAPTSTLPEPTEFSGYVRTPRLDVSSVTLPAADGTPVNMVAKPGGLRLVYFGYTTCPDVCPTTLGFVKMAYLDLSKADQDRVDVDMISIDPSRDTAEKLSKYVALFVPSANAIRTDDQVQLRAAAKAFGAAYKTSVNFEGEREVSHTDDLYAVDDTGTVILAWPFGISQPDFERDLLRLLAGERPEVEEPTN